jgi:hypothetical protein
MLFSANLSVQRSIHADRSAVAKRAARTPRPGGRGERAAPVRRSLRESAAPMRSIASVQRHVQHHEQSNPAALLPTIRAVDSPGAKRAGNPRFSRSARHAVCVSYNLFIGI